MEKIDTQELISALADGQLPQTVHALATVPAREQPAANDWHWKLAAGVASVAAVGAFSWNMWTSSGAIPVQPQLAVHSGPAAVVPVVATTDLRPPAILRDARLDQLLQAHRQLGGATALQTSSGFLRNAAFDGPA